MLCTSKIVFFNLKILLVFDVLFFNSSSYSNFYMKICKNCNMAYLYAVSGDHNACSIHQDDKAKIAATATKIKIPVKQRPP